MNVETKDPHERFFDQVIYFLDKSIFEFQSVEIRDIQIFMPNYFQGMWANYLRRVLDYDGNVNLVKTYRGIEILDNYQNNIVVSFKGIQTSSKSPYTLQIP